MLLLSNSLASVSKWLNGDIYSLATAGSYAGAFIQLSTILFTQFTLDGSAVWDSAEKQLEANDGWASAEVETSGTLEKKRLHCETVDLLPTEIDQITFRRAVYEIY